MGTYTGLEEEKERSRTGESVEIEMEPQQKIERERRSGHIRQGPDQERMGTRKGKAQRGRGWTNHDMCMRAVPPSFRVSYS
jgi:hypothetical protein